MRSPLSGGRNSCGSRLFSKTSPGWASPLRGFHHHTLSCFPLSLSSAPVYRKSTRLYTTLFTCRNDLLRFAFVCEDFAWLGFAFARIPPPHLELFPAELVERDG